MKIYIVRHAKTDANTKKYIQGQQDSAITDEGLVNAKKMAEFFKDVKIDKMFVSPIGRTRRTAELIAEASGFDKSLQRFDDRLMEIDLEPWVYKKIAEIDHSDAPSSYKTYREHPDKFIPLGGEDVYAVQKRTGSAFEDIIAASDSDDVVVIVSHSMAIRSMLTYIENKGVAEVWSYDIPPVSITEVNYDGHNTEVECIGKVVY